MKTVKKTLIPLILALALCLSALPARADALWEAPDAPATREIVAAALWEMAGAPVVNYALPFADVDQAVPYAEAVRWAAAQGVVIGVGEGKFQPEGEVSREMLAVMLYRYAKSEEMDVSVGEDTNILSYDDSFQWSEWAVPALQWAVGAGLLTDHGGLLGARDTVTQQEAEELFSRFSLLDGGTLSAIKARGVLRAGTAGDYQPMSYLDPATGRYVGFDAELAEDLAAALGVELEYVPTTWPTLMADTLAGKFDLAICGITITEARQEQALMSDGYLGNGKTVLCRAEDAGKYTSLEAINRPEVRVMENPGGLNEKFARENLPDATLIIHDVNQEIPGLVAAGEADVMITEIMEAGYYVGQDSRLAAPLIYEPFTHGQLGVLMPKGSETLLNYVNAFLAEEKASGRIDALAEEYIYRYTAHEEQLQPAA
ncbi:MAG: transporter substrate-binding domain-containing protein [Oscillospiraceae bacterium]|nr:transporter substrate-binding domain-containing protein [Oscillospiraceae bacterium]